MLRRAGGVHDVAADVFEVDVDAVRGGFRKLGGPVVGAVVDGRVEAEPLGHQRTLLGPAGDPDDARTRGLSKLTRDRADRPGRRRDHDRLPRLRPADVAHPDPGEEPWYIDRRQPPFPPARVRSWPARTTGYQRYSTMPSPSIRRKSTVFAVTTGIPNRKLVQPIQRSLVPISSPRRRSSRATLA